MDLLQAPFKKEDEFAIFSKALKYLHGQDPNYVNGILSALNENDKKALKEFIETKRIKLNIKG